MRSINIYISFIRHHARIVRRLSAASCIFYWQAKNYIFTIRNQCRWKPVIATSWELKKKFFFMSLSSLHIQIKVHCNLIITRSFIARIWLYDTVEAWLSLLILPMCKTLIISLFCYNTDVDPKNSVIMRFQCIYEKIFLFISNCGSNKRCLSMPRIITENVVHSVKFLDLPSG